eukprot:CAMPEP_0201549482 /NCGR_PEP_ID=MMETSP0173_2-20130828/5951_1 /ASSEMBLY_ACC=CAM_ASM_000268 /TAXON_ID=218659 /ORGANISM="Vexillifera sp., Strain DIVA3 564/2" /LENGTH=362 /DNA_ID=CAMNT_0047959165 /DNA_START=373 /DNA_END=1461 /DNA_ORIENTATION=+
MTLLFLWKILLGVAIAIVSFVGALIPTKLADRLVTNKALFLSRANALGAGILLGTAILHLMVDAEHEFPASVFPQFSKDEAQQVERVDSLIALICHLLAVLGFLMSFALEKVYFGHGHSHDFGHHSHLENHSHFENHSNHSNSNHSDSDHSNHSDSNHSNHSNHSDSDHNIVESDTMYSIPLQPLHHDDDDEDSGSDIIVQHNSLQPVRQREGKFPLMLFLLLGIESIVSGSALGIESQTKEVLIVFLAIVTHIWAESFTLCVALLKSGRVQQKTLTYMGAYSFLTMVGILMGMLLEKIFTGALVSVITAVLLSVAAGSFLYVSILEIMVEEFHENTSSGKNTKFALLMLGFVFMAIVAFFF